MSIKRWEVPVADEGVIQALQDQTGLSRLICGVLAARGYKTAEQAEKFLKAGRLSDPFSLKDMDKAVERITRAVQNGERVAVYGDYDCDGITSTVLLTSYLESAGADVLYKIPTRDEGYGLNMDAVRELAEEGVGLIVTVDNGISALKEISYAVQLGMDVVVTDHHKPQGLLPDAAAVVDPHRADCESGCRQLAGVGVVFKLICAMEGDEGYEMLEYYSDLVCVGTIGDVMPLTGENRTMVKHGLERLASADNPGLAALMEAAGISGKELSGGSVAFGIVPRINVAGRLGSADRAVELLRCEHPDLAAQIARELDELNRTRRQMEEEILADIDEAVRRNPGLLYERILILSGEGWHHGLIGIAASKVLERYGKPVILLSVEDGIARGSGRSIEGFSIIDAVAACSDLLTKFGGHTLAAGMTLAAIEIEHFTARILEYARDNAPVMPVPVSRVDCVLDAGCLRLNEVEQLQLLEPTGEGNRPPVFLMRSLRVDGMYPTSDKKHIRLKLSGANGNFYAIYFRVTEETAPCKIGDQVDILANVGLSLYNGEKRLSVRAEDIRLSGADQEAAVAGRQRYHRYRSGELDQWEELVPGREDLAVLYRYLKNSGRTLYSLEGIFWSLRSAVDYCKIAVGLDMMEELGLIARSERDGMMEIRLVPAQVKVDIEKASVIQRLKEQASGASLVHN